LDSRGGILEDIFDYKIQKIEADIMEFVDIAFENLMEVYLNFKIKTKSSSLIPIIKLLPIQ